MPTSSQSQILSAVDYQLVQQQQATGQDGTTINPTGPIWVNQTTVTETRRRRSKDERRPSTGRKDDDERYISPRPNLTGRRRSSNEDVLHMPIAQANNKNRVSMDSTQYRR